jgi:hypothetical protein
VTGCYATTAAVVATGMLGHEFKGHLAYSAQLLS